MVEVLNELRKESTGERKGSTGGRSAADARRVGEGVRVNVSIVIE